MIEINDTEFATRMRLTVVLIVILVAWVYVKDEERMEQMRKESELECNPSSDYRTAMILTLIMWPILCWYLFPAMLLGKNKMLFGLTVCGPISYLGAHIPKVVAARDRLRTAFGHGEILSMLALTTAYKGSGLHLRNDLMPLAIGGTCVLVMGAALFEGSEGEGDVEGNWTDGVGDSLRVGAAFTLFASVYGSIQRT